MLLYLLFVHIGVSLGVMSRLWLHRTGYRSLETDFCFLDFTGVFGWFRGILGGFVGLRCYLVGFLWGVGGLFDGDFDVWVLLGFGGLMWCGSWVAFVDFCGFWVGLGLCGFWV